MNAIEHDSYAHHLGRENHDRDGARRNAIVGLRWRPITATPDDARTNGRRLAVDLGRAMQTGVGRSEEFASADAGSLGFVGDAVGGRAGQGWRRTRRRRVAILRPTVPMRAR